jgi:hypothetical protein
MERRPPENFLRATIRVGQEAGKLTLSYGTQEPVSFENELGFQSLRDLRKGLDRDLEKFLELVGTARDMKDRDVGRVSDALKLLLRRGRLIGSYLLGVQRGRNPRGEVQAFFLRACPNWLKADPLRGVYAPPLLEVESHEDHVVPLELVPFFDFSEPDPALWETWDGLEMIMRRLPVFSMVIRRRSPSLGLVTRLRLVNAPRLKLKLFQHAGLACDGSEAEFFEANAPSFEVEGPWPSAPLGSDEFTGRFVRHVMSPSQTFDSQPCEAADQVHHFACHAEFDSAVPDKSALILAHARGKEVTVSLGDLHGGLLTVEDETLGDEAAMPLIFLNACEGAVMYAGSASFARFFLTKNYNRAFLGAECKVPNRVAARFACLFYKYLLNGYSAGHALYLAKWRLFKEHRNPLGALYTLYGCTDLRVTNPVHDVTCPSGGRG